jgi:hypothetical protein
MRWGRSHDEVSGEPWSVTGAPWPGTEMAVAALEPGAASVATVDPSFDDSAFVAWASTVYERATVAWSARDPEPLRPVMDGAVWHAYATHLLAGGAFVLARALMSMGRASASLVGTSAGGGKQSALVAFDVIATDPRVSDQRWQERWLFQRDGSRRTHPSGAVAVCPVCGGPARPEETGRCRYCHADITTRTAGWLVTQTATTMTRLARIDQKVAEIRERTAAKIPIPPAPVATPPRQPPRAGPSTTSSGGGAS